MIVRYLKDDELTHHGIKGQKWGVRRYQNPDGTLTNAGKKRLFKDLKNTEYVKAHNKTKTAIGYMKDRNAENLIRKNIERTDLEKYKKAHKKLNDISGDWDVYTDKAFEHIGDEKWQEYNKKYKQALNEKMEISKQITNKLLGKYGNKPLITKFGKRKGKDVVNTLLTEIADDELEDEELFGMPYDKIPEHLRK